MDARIKEWQDYLKSSPLGVGYGGPSDGEMNDQLKTSLQSLEAKLREAKKPMTLLSGDTVATDVSTIKSLIEQVAKETKPVEPAPIKPQPQDTTIIAWKKYLQGKGLYSGDVNSDAADDAFKSGMRSLEEIITKRVPTVSGMIWQNGQVNPQANIADVEEALKLLAENSPKTSVAVTNFDELGPPTASDFIGVPFKQMFISQEDSKLDEWSPQGNQNQGKWQSEVPEKPADAEKPKQQENSSDIDDRMRQLTELIESVKK